MTRKPPICAGCKREMRWDQETEHFDGMWVCDPCDDKAIDHANARAEWNYYHRGDGK